MTQQHPFPIVPYHTIPYQVAKETLIVGMSMKTTTITSTTFTTTAKNQTSLENKCFPVDGESITNATNKPLSSILCIQCNVPVEK